MAIEIRAREDVLDDFARVPVPNVVLHSLPLWMAGCRREGTLIFEVIVLPLNVAEADHIDLSMKIEVVRNGGRVIVRDQCCGPQFQDVVDLPLREFRVGEKEVSKFKTGPGGER